MNYQPFALDPRNQSHRLVAVAVEQAQAGKVLTGVGSAQKALEGAWLRQDFPSVMVACGYFSDALGLVVSDSCRSYWESAVSSLAVTPWLGSAAQQRWQIQMQGYARRAEMELFK